MPATVTPMPEGFGAEITGVDLSKPIDDETRRVIYGAFLDHHLITVPGQTLNTEQTVAAGRIFGEGLEPHMFKRFHHPDTALIMVLSNRTDDGDKPTGMADAGTFWHSDVSYNPNPAKATLLYALEIPDEGGDTLFCDLTRAYEALADDIKEKLDGLRAFHDYDNVKRDIFSTMKMTPPPECLHPVVRTHPETGRKAIYINPAYTTRFEGVDEDEGEALKKKIFSHCLGDRFRLRYKWRTGDLVAWDNAALMHSATTKTLDPAKHRTLWRVTVSGGPTT